MGAREGMAFKVRPEHFELEELPRSYEWMVGSEASSLSSESLGCCGRQ